MKFDILNRFSGEVQISAEIDCAADTIPSVKLGLAVKWAIKEKKDLGGADLRGADLRGANLGSANLGSADLRSADLGGADLGSANLGGADLRGADLRGANLGSANLGSADLRSADLGGADLRGANLGSADLRSADLGGADLRGANLGSADLGSADLREAKNAELPIAQTRILPEGSIIGWKKCQNGVIVKLRIPEEAKRSHAFGRKCRAEFADVVEVIGAEVGVSMHDYSTEYRAGQRVTPDRFDENWMEECAPGIHFFITRIEAENY
ncbi:pentapeptide repeat-containing protein [Rhizobium sp. CBN3]|uniref:pentapeptide repeat-containing protein n=1 Tax=Rhizobium sp. CBN3 TaxID=3058045 RepID=UPI0026710854|nr:pentapeptide repeat-containing protein [Rhizobium sp. CBN3]MDO3431139.1 pentapeptide repeat-containing protein [Rhizobium sp. CBN3]